MVDLEEDERVDAIKSLLNSIGWYCTSEVASARCIATQDKKIEELKEPLAIQEGRIVELKNELEHLQEIYART
ncbi:hypothetical protein LIER_43269 [Lithospermum erythrorhizon]|uniref:Uncharacterized protein n=1 Tax=Lithospermum erythrorhizon TaxID=34254 RepID=A0AAV3PRZ8_LITER